QRGLQHQDAGRPEGGAAPARPGAAGPGAAGPVRRSHALPAVGRPAAAGGVVARADHQAPGPPAGRAAVGAGRVLAPADARRAATHAEGAGITFVHVTHTQLEAIAVADLVVVMDQGRIEQAGSAREIYTL